jgi:hypothetical protein
LADGTNCHLFRNKAHTGEFDGLRLDNMPCIVPDTKHLAAMPNALPYFQPPKIRRMRGASNKTTSILPSKSMVK